MTGEELAKLVSLIQEHIDPKIIHGVIQSRSRIDNISSSHLMDHDDFQKRHGAECALGDRCVGVMHERGKPGIEIHLSHNAILGTGDLDWENDLVITGASTPVEYAETLAKVKASLKR